MKKNRKNLRNRRQLKTVYCVVVEGKTEQWYLQLMKKNERLPKIDIKPELPKRKKLSEIKEFIIELIKKDYDGIFWLIDLDYFTNKGLLNELGQIMDDLKKEDKSNKLEILINNPCLEFWYLLHFRDTGRQYVFCNEVIREIKNSTPLKEYNKSQKFYKGNPDIYKRLKQYQKEAIERASTLDKLTQQLFTGAKAQIYKLLKKIGVK